MYVVSRPEKERAACVKLLEGVDDFAYFSCLWEEFITSGKGLNNTLSELTLVTSYFVCPI